MKFGQSSQENLNTIVYSLRSVFNRALGYEVIDFSIIEGHRTKEKQDDYFNNGASKVQWPNSKHNSLPSKAGDAAPYINGRISWNKQHCCVLAGVILAAAAELGIKVRWGGNWDMDNEPITDQDFQDLVHYEVID